DIKKIEYLLALDGAKERLSLFEANLLEEGSFESAINDCECVFHTASPVLFSVSDPQSRLDIFHCFSFVPGKTFGFWCYGGRNLVFRSSTL
nr:tetraketide alpha-pyrone reductase 1-like [Tanacetum cinerariifolium]